MRRYVLLPLLALVASPACDAPSASERTQQQHEQAPTLAASLPGTWRHVGQGHDGGRFTREFTFVAAGIYTAKTTHERRSGTYIEVTERGRWEAGSGTLTLIREHESFDSLGGGDPIVKTDVVIKSLRASLSDAGELTIKGEDGNCPSSACTRIYTRRP